MLLLPVLFEEGIESPNPSRGGYRPDEQRHGQRQPCRPHDDVREREREHRGEPPDGGLEPVPLRRAVGRLLVPLEAVEQQQEVEVAGDDERDGCYVALRVVDRHGGVEGEEGEASKREPGETDILMARGYAKGGIRRIVRTWLLRSHRRGRSEPVSTV